jgi:Ig-like domain from next to BRCA1 gene
MSKTAQSPRRQAQTNEATRQQGRRALWATPSAKAAVIAGGATVTAALVTGVFTMVSTLTGTASSPNASSSVSPRPSSSSLPHSRIPGDQSTFIRDVTFPDNSIVRTDQRFIKKWELKNTGTVRWVDRYLIPEGTSTGNCSYPSRIPVPATNPGQTVVIRVPVTAASAPGLCYVTWKMANASGALYFPGYLGIWFEVKVLRPISHPAATPSWRPSTAKGRATATGRTA